MDYSKVTLVEYEKRKKEVFNALRDELFRKEFGDNSCEGVDCRDCPFGILCNDNGSLEDAEMNEPVKAAQLIMEFEPPVDWSKVPVDTEIWVRNHDNEAWCRRHFARYNGEEVKAWVDGMTSYTTKLTKEWAQAKLYNEEDK